MAGKYRFGSFGKGDTVKVLKGKHSGSTASVIDVHDFNDDKPFKTGEVTIRVGKDTHKIHSSNVSPVKEQAEPKMKKLSEILGESNKVGVPGGPQHRDREHMMRKIKGWVGDKLENTNWDVDKLRSEAKKKGFHPKHVEKAIDWHTGGNTQKEETETEEEVVEEAKKDDGKSMSMAHDPGRTGKMSYDQHKKFTDTEKKVMAERRKKEAATRKKAKAEKAD
jgi:hypothetical protein